MSRLFKRGSFYWYDFRLNGSRYRGSTGKTTWREAENAFDEKKREIKEGKSQKAESVKICKVVELATKYSEWVKHQKSYMKSKRFFIKEIVITFGHLKVNDLRVFTVERWQSKRLEHSKPSTVNRITSCLKHMITKGQEWSVVDQETAEGIKGIKQLKEDNRRLRFLNLEECQTLIDCCHEHLKPIVTVALHTGMRRGEILNLKWSQIDLKHGFILLDMTKNGSRREIPVNTTLEEIFNSLRNESESEYVFFNKKGQPFADVKRSFSTALKKACILDFRFHDLRHTFASHLVMQGIDLTTVRELLGHKDIKMTLRYAHLAPGHKKRAVDVLDKLMRQTELEDFGHNFGHSEDKTQKAKIFGHNLGTISSNDVVVKSRKSLSGMVGATGFEPATS